MNRSDRRNLARSLRAARLNLGLSQWEAARRLGIPRSAVSLIENGKRDVSLFEFAALCRVYGIDPATLLATGRAESPALREVKRLRRSLERVIRQLARLVEQIRKEVQ